MYAVDRLIGVKVGYDVSLVALKGHRKLCGQFYDPGIEDLKRDSVLHILGKSSPNVAHILYQICAQFSAM